MDVVVEGLVHVHRGGVRAVDGVSLRIASGESLGLIGPNGAGKSTLLACLLAFVRPTRGRVRIDGLEPDDLRVRARLGVLSEKPAFPQGLSARGVLAFHHALLSRPRGSRRRECDALLERVGLESVAGRAPSTFSHGMRQRLGLACALLGDPQLLVLDEPATGLDPPATLLLREEIRAARDRGATIVLSSHQLDEVGRLCGRIAFLDRGRLVVERATAEVFAGARVLTVRLGSEPAPATIAALGARVLARDGTRLRLSIAGDEDAGATIGELVRAGLLVVEASSESTPLERLFEGSPR